jgi:ribosomal-protein-alanine N-acetyltransferase
MIIPILKTERLLLRPLKMSDLDALFLLRSDESSSNFNDSVADVTKDQTFVYLIKTLNDIDQQKYWKWAIDLDGALIGTIAIWNYNPIESSAEFGYTLRSPFRGIGYMSESLQSLLDYGHHALGIKNLYVYTEVSNQRSNRLVPKLGFVYQGTVDEEGVVKQQIFHYNVYLHRDE